MATSRRNQEHTRTIRLVPYETHVSTSSVMPRRTPRLDDEIHVLMGQGRLKSAVLDTLFVPYILNEQRKATLSLFQFKPLFDDFQTASQIHSTKELICGMCSITDCCIFSLLTKKYPTVHVTVWFQSV